jgi:2-dehydro-3-deoxygluconokinase
MQHKLHRAHGLASIARMPVDVITPESSSSPRITCIGEGLAVLTASPGSLESAETFSRSAGGAEANVAVGLSQLGIAAFWSSRVGNDGFGRFITTQLAGRGVDVAAVVIDQERPTGMYVKEVGSVTGAPNDLGAGRSGMHYYRSGSSASAFSPDFLTEAAVATAIENSTIVHTSGITAALSAGAYDMLLALATQLRTIRSTTGGGATLSFDLNWRPRLWAGRTDVAADRLATLVRLADTVLMGADEADAVFGSSDPTELRAMFPEPRRLVIKDDSNLVTAFDGSHAVVVAATTVDVVEPVGAGDAFAAGYLAGIASGRSDLESVRQGHLVAAQVLLQHGDTAEIRAHARVTPHLELDSDSWARLRFSASQPTGIPT